MTRSFLFKGLLQRDGWLSSAAVTVDESGVITSISEGGEASENIAGYALPGFQNAHSHAFQYAMAGLAERHETGAEADDFWSWREAMYNLALSIDPDEMQAIAAMLYAEMVRHGYTHVAEFHYVHHDKDGSLYGNLSEMGERLVAAAQQAGIRITLVPIFYQKGGFGLDPTEGQRRFISQTNDAYYDLYEASKLSCSHYRRANTAIGIHSMRGVEPADIAEVAANKKQGEPFHIHISEQLKEIEDSIAYLGQRPVEWLADNLELTDEFHLVHATHLVDIETDAIAAAGANVVLCPSTEGNLGDGLFPLRRFQDKGGQWSIGTDSHVGLNPFEELRILDYGQRTTTHKRNTFTSALEGDSGMHGIRTSWFAGKKAMGENRQDFFEVGQPLDAVVMDAKVPLLAGCSPKNLTSTMVYSTDVSMQLGTLVDGAWVVKEGRHQGQDQIRESFTQAIDRIKNR